MAQATVEHQSIEGIEGQLFQDFQVHGIALELMQPLTEERPILLAFLQSSSFDHVGELSQLEVADIRKTKVV